MITDAPELSAGSLVRVRQRTYLVEGVKTVPGTSAVVQLVLPAGRSALKPDIQPDDPKTFAAYLHALRWGCVTSTDPSLFQAPLRAGIVPKSYQLEPLRKAVRQRARARVIYAEEKLRQRATSEADEMRRILEAQRAGIEKELVKHYRLERVGLVYLWPTTA